MSILCVGQLVADIVVRPVEALPVEGRADLVEDLQLLAGGCAANTASVLAKFGAPVALAALIGRDAFGDAVLADLATTGVRTDRVVRNRDVPTSAAIVLVNGAGQRSFFYHNGGNERFANVHGTTMRYILEVDDPAGPAGSKKNMRSPVPVSAAPEFSHSTEPTGTAVCCRR